MSIAEANKGRVLPSNKK